MKSRADRRATDPTPRRLWFEAVCVVLAVAAFVTITLAAGSCMGPPS